LVLTDRELPPGGVAVFLHSVARGREAEFVSAQANLTADSSRFPGYEGTVVFPPDPSGQFPPDALGQWMSVLRFRTAHQLTGWLRSRERQDALPGLRAHLTRNFSEFARSAPFGSTVRTDDGETRITPAWKTAMLVLLCLYPTVMLLSKLPVSALEHLGVAPSLTVFVSNVISVVLLQWVLVPTVSRPFRRWLDPIDGAGRRISLAGAAVLVLCYAAVLALFAWMGSLHL
jgi:antibiotic biosynthesis monooxygenase (ABM) superfamily enzyme